MSLPGVLGELTVVMTGQGQNFSDQAKPQEAKINTFLQYAILLMLFGYVTFSHMPGENGGLCYLIVPK